MNDIHSRTKFLVETLGPNRNAFAVKTKTWVQQVHFIIGSRKARKSEPHFDFIYKVLTTFPQINPYWYILGKGKWSVKNSKAAIKEATKQGQLIKELTEMKILYAEERLLNESLKEKLRKKR